jgi:hypothetical protein
MSFADDAIGFYLQLEDQLTPALKSARDSYADFVKSLDKYNQQAFKSANKGMMALAHLIESFEELPVTAEEAYTEAIKKVQKKVKPIVQPLAIVFTPKNAKVLAKAVSGAVADVLSKVTLRLSASIPLKKNKYFDTTVSLRQLYKDQAQPPDMRGAFQHIPKFAKGGIVPGPGGIDEILALLTPGEAVLPVSVVKDLRKMAKGKFVSKGLAEALANVENLGMAADKLKDLAELGIDPKAQTKYNKALDVMNEQLEAARVHYKKMPTSMQRALIPALKKATGQVKDFTKEGEEASDTYSGLLTKILGAERFQAIHKALGSVQEAFGKVRSETSTLGAELGITQDETKGFVSGMMEVNKTVGWTRDEMFKFTEDLVATSRRMYGGAVSTDGLKQAMETLAFAGMRSKEQFAEFAPIVEMAAQATGAGPDSLAAMAYKLADSYEFSGDRVASFFENMRQVAAQANINILTLTEQMQSGLDEGMGAFMQTIGDPAVQQTVIQQFAVISGALTSQWADTGGQMVQAMSNALTDPQAFSKLSKILPMGFEEFQQRLKKGDAAGILQEMTSNMRQFADTDPLALQPIMEALEIDMTPQAFQKLIQSGEGIVGMAEQLNSSFTNTSNGLSTLTKSSENAKSGWEEFKDGVSLWFTEKVGVNLQSFLEEFNPQVLISAGYLGKMGLEAAGAGLKLVKGLGGALAGVIKKVFTFNKAAKGMQAVTTATQAAGAAGGVGGGGFLTGLAAGLTALVPALKLFGKAMLGYAGLGLLALIATGYAIVGMVRLLAPALIDIGQAFAVALTPIMDAFKVMSAGQIATATGALLLMGPAFLGFGAGVLGMSVMLAASAIGFGVFAAAMKLFGSSALVGEGGVIANTVGKIARIFQGNAKDQAMMENAQKTIGSMSTFMMDYAKIVKAVRGLAIDATWSAATDSIVKFWGGSSPMEMLVAEAQTIIDTVQTLATKFKGVQIVGLDDAQVVMGAMVKFATDYATTVQSLTDVAPGYWDRAVTAFMGLFADGPMVALSKESGRIVLTIAQIIANFQSLGEWLNQRGGPDTAVNALEAAGKVVQGFKPLAEGVRDTADIIDDLADGWIFSGTLTKLVENTPKFVRGIRGIMTEMFMVANAYPDQIFDSVVNATQKSARVVGATVAVVRNLNLLGEAIDDSGSSVDTINSRLTGTSLAIRRVMQHMTGVQKLKQELSAPSIPATEIQKVITVELDPSTTDKPVLEATEETNTLLRQMIALLAGGTGAAAAPAAAGGGRVAGKPDGRLQDMSGGRT